MRKFTLPSLTCGGTKRVLRLVVLLMAITIANVVQAKDCKGKIITDLAYNDAVASDGYYSYDLSTSDNGSTYTVDIPYSAIKDKSTFRFLFYFDEFSDNKYIVATSNDQEWNINDSYNIAGDNYAKSRSNFFKATNVNAENYKSGLTITVNIASQTISASPTVRYEFQKNGNTSWSRFDKYLYPNCFDLKIRRLDGTGTHYMTSTSPTFATSGTAVSVSWSDTESEASAFHNGFEAQNDYGYEISFATDNSTATLTAANSTTKKYYLVFSNFTSNDKHKSYLLFKPLRHRSGGAVTDSRAGELSINKFVLNLKKDEIWKYANLTADGNVNYWIEDEDGNVYGANNQSNRNLFNESTKTTKGGMATYNGGSITTKAVNNVNYIYNSNGFWLTSNGTTTPTGGKLLELATSNGVSFTWILNIANPDGNNNPILTQITNTQGVGNDNSGSDISTDNNGKRSLYVIGNFNDQRLNGSWNVSESTGHKQMERRIYYKSSASEYAQYPNGYLDEAMTTAWDATKMDSIVYSITISRPAIGWSSLYLAFAPGSKFPVSQTAANAAWWGTGVIRPEGPWWGTEASSTNEQGMDVSSLRGGLFIETATDKDYSDNASQAIDPVVYAYGDPESYTLTVNVTTATYRIYFQDPDDHIYLVGPAISANTSTKYNPSLKDISTWTAGTGTASTSTDVNTWTGSGLQFTYDTDEQCYKYLDADGTEQPIQFINGQEFAFRTGTDFTKPYYIENSDVPTDLTSDGSLDLFNKYSAGATNLDAGKSSDTGYFDVLDANPGNASSTSLPSNPMKWKMDERTTGYTIRLYIKSIGDKSYSFYTVSRGFLVHDLGAKYDPVTATESDNGCQYWRAFSDYQAYDIPEGLHVYIVTGTIAKAATGHQTDQLQGSAKVEDITSLGYIPANTGVLLGMNSEQLVQNDPYHHVSLNVHVSDPWTTLPSTYTNLLTASPAKTTGLDQSKHFAFNLNNSSKPGFYYLDANYLYASNNSSFLTVNSSSKAKGVGMAYTFGVYDFGETTGIDKPETNNTIDNAPYYTLMGVKINGKPSLQGVYIHNGKKVIVK